MKDVSVELARIIAAASVVGVHTFIGSQNGGVYDFSRILIACFVADGVGVFWMITGFFALDSGKDYKKVLLRTVDRVVLPAVCLSLVMFFFYDWLLGKETIAGSAYHTPEECLKVLESLVIWQNGVEGAGHLWYVYTYCLLILGLPILRPFARCLDRDPKATRRFLCISFGLLALNDATQNRFLEFGYHTIDSVVPAALFVLWGYVFYRHRARFCSAKFAIPAVLGFLAVNLLRAHLVKDSLALQGINPLQYWYTTFGLASSLCILVFCCSVTGLFGKKREGASLVVVKIGALTFSVYLVHVLVIAFLRRLGTVSVLRHFFIDSGSSFATELAYTVLVVGLVFAGSLFVAFLLQQFSFLAKEASGKLTYLCQTRSGSSGENPSE